MISRARSTATNFSIIANTPEKLLFPTNRGESNKATGTCQELAKTDNFPLQIVDNCIMQLDISRYFLRRFFSKQVKNFSYRHHEQPTRLTSRSSCLLKTDPGSFKLTVS